MGSLERTLARVVGLGSLEDPAQAEGSRACGSWWNGEEWGVVPAIRASDGLCKVRSNHSKIVGENQ